MNTMKQGRDTSAGDLCQSTFNMKLQNYLGFGGLYPSVWVVKNILLMLYLIFQISIYTAYFLFRASLEKIRGHFKILYTFMLPHCSAWRSKAEWPSIKDGRKESI